MAHGCAPIGKFDLKRCGLTGGLGRCHKARAIAHHRIATFQGLLVAERLQQSRCGCQLPLPLGDAARDALAQIDAREIAPLPRQPVGDPPKRQPPRGLPQPQPRLPTPRSSAGRSAAP